MTGDAPFRDRSKRELYRKILTEKVAFPKYLSPAAVSLIKGLLERNVDRRLGCGRSTMFETKGIPALKAHAFFRGLDWDALARRAVPARTLISALRSAERAWTDPRRPLHGSRQARQRSGAGAGPDAGAGADRRMRDRGL
jgi:hypothetical protein